MQLIIAEKPSMGREIAAALRVTNKKEGYLEGANYIVTWCIGHLVELAEPEVYDPKYAKWQMADLPIIPNQFRYQPNSKTFDQFKVIKELIARHDVSAVINACDAGREGELIFALVYALAKGKKPVQRLWISSLTVDEIVKGFKNLRPGIDYQGLRDSAYARQQSDWLVGINGTRAFSLKAKGVGNNELYSLGRVQTPTLALIVERDKEIAQFVPVTFYQVLAEFQAPAGNYLGFWFNADGNRLDNLEKAQAIAQKVLGKPGVIEKVEKKPFREKAPYLFDLTTLQRVANARYGLSAAHTLELAQSLYEKKFITYPRTASQHLSSGVAQEIKDHLEAANFGPYAVFVNQIVSSGRLKLTSRHVDDKKVTDHHAIICTKQKVSGSLSDNEKRIYDLIVRRFLGAFFPDAELERTTIITKVSNETFMTRGTQVINPGWRVVNPPFKAEAKKSDDEDSEKELPLVQAKQPVNTVQAEALTKQTKAPPSYSEASLLGAMESAGKEMEDEELRLALKESGLGTPATRASIIETLLKRGYLERDKKALKSTPKGSALINLLPAKLLKSAELTGMWEKKLTDMAHNNYPFDQFMQEVQTMVKQQVEEIVKAEMGMVLKASEKADTTNNATSKSDKALACPKCAIEKRDGHLVEIQSPKGKFVVCSLGRDRCGYISDLPKNSAQRKGISQTRCPNCQGAMRLRLPKEKDQKAVLLCLNYSQCKGVAHFDEKGSITTTQAKVETGPPCKTCGAPTIKRGPFKTKNGDSYFWGCSKWKPNNAGCNAQPNWI